MKKAATTNPENLKATIEEMKAILETGNGAQFWVYISTKNNTSENLKSWSVKISQGSWSGEINSKNPKQILKTAGRSGLFDVVVKAEGTNFEMQQIQPGKGATKNIGCNSNCASMVKIELIESGDKAFYYPTWDAICS